MPKDQRKRKPGRRPPSPLSPPAAPPEPDLPEKVRRGHALPPWFNALGPLWVEMVLETTHAFGDATQVLIGVQSPTGHAFTAVLVIEHHAGHPVTDGFVVEEPILSVGVAMCQVIGADPETALRPLDHAEARARATQGIAQGEMLDPPYESDTWPACRPIIERVLDHLPEGGCGYVRPEWEEEEHARLREAFFASPFGAGCHDEDRDLLDWILWFICDYGPRDPLCWSHTAVEILFVKWLPTPIFLDADHLGRAPEVLRRFIRYGHAERGLLPELIADTLALIDELEPAFQEVIRQPQAQRAEAMLVALGVVTKDKRPPDDDG